MRLRTPCRARYIGPASSPAHVQTGEQVTIVRQGGARSGAWYDENYGLVRRDYRPWTKGKAPRDRWMSLDWFDEFEPLASTGTDG